MKFYITKTEDWDIMDEAIAGAIEFFKTYNIDIQIDSTKIDLDVSNPLYYHTSYSWSWLQRKKTKSLHGAVVRTQALVNGAMDKGYDYYGIMVDKDKSLEKHSLNGQHSRKYKTIEIYVKKTNRTRWGLPHNTYTLVHEILHAMANHYGFEDNLHEYLTKNKDNLDKYMEQILPHIVPTQALEEDWKHKYFKPTEKTGSMGTCADLQDSLLKKLDKAREYAGIPFIITSGFRTLEHNRKVGGASNSAHLRGLAADIKVSNSSDRQKVLEAGIKAGFNRYGIAKTFIHFDCDSNLPQNKTWLY